MTLFKRENYLKKLRGFYHAADIIKVIPGVRRCGKSSLMEIVAEELRGSGVSSDRIVFLNLDKRGYRKINTADQLDELIACFPRTDDLMYRFIDEVQNASSLMPILRRAIRFKV